MQERHREYRRDLTASDRAVLFIHGICGSPCFFDPFYDRVPDTWSIRSLLIRGHGGTTKDFCRASMAKWKAQLAEVVDEMSDQHSDLMLVGHSMGTLLAIEQALKRPDAVKKLFLLAVPLKARASLQAISESVKTALDLGKRDSPSLQAARRLYGIEADRKVWHYLGYIPRYWELLQEMKATRGRVQELRLPCLAFQSAKDEIVSPKSALYLQQNPLIDLRILAGSDHKYHPPQDQALLLDAFESACLS